jgi:hypothetical protein
MAHRYVEIAINHTSVGMIGHGVDAKVGTIENHILFRCGRNESERGATYGQI